jgi:hypothetical protein
VNISVKPRFLGKKIQIVASVSEDSSFKARAHADVALTLEDPGKGPEILLEAPGIDGATVETTDAEILVKARVRSPRGLTKLAVLVNGKLVSEKSPGAEARTSQLEERIAVASGENLIAIEAVSPDGRRAQAEVAVVRTK